MQLEMIKGFMAAAKILPRSAYADRLREYSEFAFAEEGAFGQRGKWREFFRSRIGADFDGRIVLEIGCFDAKYLSDIALENPRTAFVGIDWKCKAIYDGAKYIGDRNLSNVALLRARGHDLLRIFDEAEVDEIWIFHPDPCDRPAELRNRLLDERFLLQVYAVLSKPTAVLALKTDHQGYYQSVLDLFELSKAVRERFELTMRSSDYWHDPVAISHTASRLFARKKTLFENRFIKKRLPIFYFELVKKVAEI